MIEKSGLSRTAKQEKLVDYSNWPIWSLITEFIFIKNDIWDLVEKRSCFA